MVLLTLEVEKDPSPALPWVTTLLGHLLCLFLQVFTSVSALVTFGSVDSWYCISSLVFLPP